MDSKDNYDNVCPTANNYKTVKDEFSNKKFIEPPKNAGLPPLSLPIDPMNHKPCSISGVPFNELMLTSPHLYVNNYNSLPIPKKKNNQ